MITLELTHPIGLLRKSGGETFEVLAGENLKVEVSPGGTEILDVIVPEGKKWIVSLSLQIVETAM